MSRRQFINQVTILGNIGSVRTMNISGKVACNFSVATNFLIRNGNETAMETTWHAVVYWAKPGDPIIGKLKVGATVQVRGRLRNQRYIAADGTERNYTEIFAAEVEIPVENEDGQEEA